MVKLVACQVKSPDFHEDKPNTYNNLSRDLPEFQHAGTKKSKATWKDNFVYCWCVKIAQNLGSFFPQNYKEWLTWPGLCEADAEGYWWLPVEFPADL